MLTIIKNNFLKIFLLFVTFVTNAFGAEMNVLLYGISIPFDTYNIGDANDYFVLLNIVRPLIGYGEDNQIVGIALEKWDISKDFKKYTFTLKPDIKFSNGEVITSEDEVNTINRLMKKNKTIHYDFSNIEKVSILDKKSFEIILKKSDNNFLESLTAPEFGVLHKSDYNSSILSFKVSSGAYFISNSLQDSILLSKNTYFGKHVLNSPESIKILTVSKIEDFSKTVEEKNIDFFPAPHLSIAEHRHFEKVGLVSKKINLGFTHFFTINPRSKVLSSKSSRKWIQKILNPDAKYYNDYFPLMEKATQLYLPDGPGRLEKDELKKIWDNIENTKKPEFKKNTVINVLVNNSKIHRDLINSSLSNHGFVVKETVFSSWEEYAKLIKNNIYDIIYANNDFSSMDLLENLKVTFNKNRPLITIDDDSNINKFFQIAINTDEKSVRYNAYKNIAESLLEEGVIVPLYHEFLIFYHKRSLDLTAWNKSVSEMPWWKISQQKK